MTTNFTYSWGEFYETTKNCSEYNEEIKRKFTVFEALDKANSIEKIQKIIEPLTQNEINWLNSSCLDGIIAYISYTVRDFFEKEYLETVKYFVQKQIYINRENINNYLNFSATVGHINTVKFLLQNGADIRHNDMIIVRASVRNHIDIVKFLLENGSNIHYNMLDINCGKGHIEIVKLLLEPLSLSKRSYTSYELGIALCKACDNSHLEIVKLLLPHKPDISIEYGYAVFNAFFKAIRNGNIDIVKLLLEYDTSIHIYYDEGLQYACEGGHFEITKLLLEKGANAQARGNIALQKAFDNSNSEMAKLLIQYGAIMSTLNYDDLRKKLKFLLDMGITLD